MGSLGRLHSVGNHPSGNGGAEVECMVCCGFKGTGGYVEGLCDLGVELRSSRLGDPTGGGPGRVGFEKHF